MTALRRCAAVGVLLASVCVSCGDESTTASPTPVTSPTTVTWTTRIGPRGSASRSFVTSQAGSVVVTLQSAPVPLEVGVGVPAANGTGCRAAVSVMAVPSDVSQLTTPVEEGTYCVLAFDVDGLADPIPFTVQLVHP